MKSPGPKKMSFVLFLIQGIAGGLLGGFAYFVVVFSQTTGNDIKSAIELAPYFLLAGSILGSIKAPAMWVIYRLIGIRLRAMARLAFASIGWTLFVVLTGLHFGLSERELTAFLVLTLSMGIPVALLVGSRCKPWELFTFGSIAAGEVDQRSGSRSILATIGSLPLRFLGIGTTAFFLLSFVFEMHPINSFSKIVKALLLFAVFGAYPSLSAYLTFRSPRKVVLSALGFVINIPVALIGLFSYSIYTKANWLGEAPLILSMFCSSFVTAWVIFLFARLTVQIGPAPSRSSISNHSITGANDLAHQCLGSRFSEWEQVA